jgi:hypothetical protein
VVSLQWAGQLALSPDERTRAAGLALLGVLAHSPLAGPAELDMLSALNDRAALERYRQQLDTGESAADDGGIQSAGGGHHDDD